jgi:hypothetical protein
MLPHFLFVLTLIIYPSGALSISSGEVLPSVQASQPVNEGSDSDDPSSHPSISSDEILPSVSSDEAPALSEAPTSSDDPLPDISSVCFLPAPECGNACNTAKGLKCTFIDAYFECGHFQCVQTTMMINSCITCSCSKKTETPTPQMIIGLRHALEE